MIQLIHQLNLQYNLYLILLWLNKELKSNNKILFRRMKCKNWVQLGLVRTLFNHKLFRSWQNLTSILVDLERESLQQITKLIIRIENQFKAHYLIGGRILIHRLQKRRWKTWSSNLNLSLIYLKMLILQSSKLRSIKMECISVSWRKIRLLNNLTN